MIAQAGAPTIIVEALASLQRCPKGVAIATLPDGEVLLICALSGGFEVQIRPTVGLVRHRCFVNDVMLLAWYVATYCDTGRV